MLDLIQKIKDYRFRPSGIKAIMVDAKPQSEVLSVGAKTFLNNIFLDMLFGEEPSVSTPQMEKGTVCEQDGIKLYRAKTQAFHTKNLEKKSNDHIAGTCDLILKDKIVDIKCSFTNRTWFKMTEKEAMSEYQWQLVSYCWLWDKPLAQIAYCGVKTPDYLLEEEVKKAVKTSRINPDNHEEYNKIEEAVYNQHTFERVPSENRIKLYDFEVTQDMINKLKSKCESAKEYLLKLAEAEIDKAIIKTNQSFVTTENGASLPIVDQLISKYKEFGIELAFDQIIQGASVDQYRFTPLRAGIKIEKAKSFNADIQALLKSDSVLIETPIVRTSQIGIQVPRENRQTVILPKIAHKDLNLSFGQTITGEDYVLDLAQAPHLLVAGSTGSGKSVFLQSLISQLENSKSAEYTILDPKREFKNSFKDIPEICEYLENIKAEILVRQKIEDKTKLKPKVIIIDELEVLLNNTIKKHYEITAEPIMQVWNMNAKGSITSKKLKNPEYAKQLTIQKAQPKYGELCRSLIQFITSIGRSEKVHLVLATQNPTVKNLDSSIKANCPTRVCFRVATQVNSQVILDTVGGEKLLGKGDMLVITPQESSPIRLQGYLVGDAPVVNSADVTSTSIVNTAGRNNYNHNYNNNFNYNQLESTQSLINGMFN